MTRQIIGGECVDWIPTGAYYLLPRDMVVAFVRGCIETHFRLRRGSAWFSMNQLTEDEICKVMDGVHNCSEYLECGPMHDDLLYVKHLDSRRN